jgi:phosphate uptake regulator
MEKRKAHRVGRSSTAVTLPHEWIHRNGITPGDDLHIHESDRNTLILTMSKETSLTGDKKAFDVRSNTPAEHLQRLLIGTYIVGANDVVFNCTDAPFSAAQLELLNESVSRLTGFLVIEQTSQLFSVHNYLEPTGTLFSEHLHQLLATTTRMVHMVPDLLSNSRTSEMCRVIFTLGNQSDILYYLIVRILLMSLSNRKLMFDLGFDSPQEVVGGRLITKSLEEICDRIECMARLVEDYDNEGRVTDEDLHANLKKRIDHICELIDVSVEGYFSGSVSLPDSALQELYDLERSKQGPLLSYIENEANTKAIGMLSGFRSLIQEVGRLTRVISEVAMNNSLRRI